MIDTSFDISHPAFKNIKSSSGEFLDGERPSPHDWHGTAVLSVLAGEVVGRESGGWVRALTVNRGRGSGVALQTPVIVPDGLVGRVVQVRPGASVVQLINDPA